MKQYTWHDTALYSRYNDKLKIQFFNIIYNTQQEI